MALFHLSELCEGEKEGMKKIKKDGEREEGRREGGKKKMKEETN